MKEKVQSFGRFLSGMVMPNIGAFIAWGLLTALFIDTGWTPNAALATIGTPMLTYLLPVLIAYQGGKMVGGPRGAVAGAVATIGVICGTEYTMLMGAMVMGPFAGWCMKKVDAMFEGHIKPGFEMLVNNFSLGILAMLLAILGFYVIGPFMAGVLNVLSAGVQVLVNHQLLPLISVFVEPAKVLSLNNAINHGIFTPLGAEQVKETGRSIFYMIETNPGPGTGVLLAYSFFAKDEHTKQSAPAALIVHLFGGIHEISFPYILMNPLLLLATIGGSVCAMIYNSIMGLGLVSPASPGSIFAFVGMAPKGETIQVLLSIVIAAGVSFLIASPIVRFSNAKKSLDSASDQMADMKAASKGATAYTTSESGQKVDLRTLDHIVFACDAGMGSSAMGSAVLQRKLSAAGFDNITVSHAPVSEIPAGTELVVCHRDLAERAVKSAPNAKLVTITDFMTAPEYDEIIKELQDARLNTNPENAEGSDFHGGILIKKNIHLNGPEKNKEEVIKEMGKVMYESGYTTEKYTEAMFEKEKVFNTAIGNEIAIPHGIESMTGEIKNSGIAIFTYPDGMDWGDGNIVKLVIGVASVGNDHMAALQKIAEACSTTEDVEKIVKMDVDEIYNLFK
ncbi:PTS mannitol transporter subunit IICBA [Catenisphaera adipataccumulans]|uniref:Mannitol-specific phosphotransferase enzyme IIA component n=1 Tax=Catenisphaera adipataccumulans TaxID=700500 RepID=A0A7W8CYJ1_9FIRM|nr:PTS mannitol transporter subunit IICBA [Catenisphaera adipataccumulans]MBB5182749.1 PTS system mannitol-specific IIC component [Catenisphaera adipataccumulans]